MPRQRKLPLLLMSGGLTPRTTAELADSLKTLVQENSVDVAAISVILGRRDRQMTWRSYAILEPGCSSPSQLIFSVPQHIPRIPNTIGLVFSGQGPQHRDMGRQLFSVFPVFRDSVIEMDSVFQSATGKSIIHDWGLFNGQFSNDIPDIWPVSLTLPSITIFQIALFDLLISLGVKPDLLCGHSAGETAVLYASGAAPKSMAVELAILRGECFSVLEGFGGSMAALSCGAELAENFLSQVTATHPSKTVEIACYNSPSAVAVSGDGIAIDEVLKIAKDKGVVGTKLKTRVPIHSSIMENCREDYYARLHNLFSKYPGSKVPQIPTYSTLTGELFTGSFDAEYFWKSTRSQVKFTYAVNNITYHSGNFTLIEIAPHPVLSAYLSAMVTTGSVVLSTIRRPNSKAGRVISEYHGIVEFCGQITAAGHNFIDFFALNQLPSRSVTKHRLPSYPFSKKKFPLYPNTLCLEKQTAGRFGPLNHPYLKLNKETHPILAEHIIRGEPIMPAAGFLDMALEFGATALMNVEFRSLLSLSSEVPTKVDVCLRGSYWSVKSTISHKGSSQLHSGERTHAEGYLTFEKPPLQVENIDIEAIRNRCQESVGSDFYKSLKHFSSYGPSMQRVAYMCYNYSEALASIQGLDDDLTLDGNYVLHPAVLDSAIQVSVYPRFHGDTNPNAYYLPAAVKTLVLHQSTKIKYFPNHIYAYLQIKDWTPNSMTYDVLIIDDQGKPLCSISGLNVAKHRINPLVIPSSPLEVVMQVFELPQLSSKLHLTMVNNRINRSRLFKYLDFLYKNSSKPLLSDFQFDETELSILRNEWPQYFNWMDEKDFRHQYNVSDSPHLDRVLSCVKSALREVLKLFTSENSQRVLRVCIGEGANLIFPHLQEVLEEFPDVFCEALSLTTNLATLHSNTHRIRIVDFDDNVPTNLRQPFDIVITLDLSFTNLDDQLDLLPFDRFLVPGGILIVAKQCSQAWSCRLPGHEWYNALFGEPIIHQQTDLNSSIHWLQKMNCQIVFSEFNPEEDPFHYLVVAQTASSFRQKIPELGSESSHLFHYQIGKEETLRRQLELLSDRENLFIVITTSIRPDGGSGRGLTRALRREYPAWTIRLVLFPHSLDHKDREKILYRLPESLNSEPEIIISDDSVIFVPRLLPLRESATSSRLKTMMPAKMDPHSRTTRHQILLQVLSSSTQGAICGIHGVVAHGGFTAITTGTYVIGLTLEQPAVGDFVPIDVDSVHALENKRVDELFNTAKYIPGFIAAVMAPGFALFGLPHRLDALRILITHGDSEIGQIILNIYSLIGVQRTVTVSCSISTLALSQMESFDLILSGFEDHDLARIQILNSLLIPETGRLFLWNREVARLLVQDPWSIGQAFRSFEMIATALCEIDSRVPPERSTTMIKAQAQLSPSLQTPQLQISSDKFYVLLGGLGNIGIHIAMFLYHHGARRILLTSRTGEDRVKNSSNIILRRMFQHLQQLPGLTLLTEAIDATSYEHMKLLLSPMKDEVAGCFILTANIQDRLFRDLSQSDFTLGYNSKVGVLDVLQSSVDITSLDFIVAFSSVSGTFGFGGQSNYGAANTALEEAVLALQNGFSFVCPGILDTSLLLASGVESTDPRLRHHIRWSISAEDMICWLEHSLYIHQSGTKLTRYIPELDWLVLDQSLGMPRLGQHLVKTHEKRTVDIRRQDEILAHIVQDVLGIISDDFSSEVPLTSYGLDSLSATRLSFLLRPFVEVTQLQLLADMSVGDLQIQAKPDPSLTDAPKPSQTKNPSKSTARQSMLEMLNKYACGLTQRSKSLPKQVISQSGQVIILTGCTGSLGCNILYHLLQCEDVAQVYAFGRSLLPHKSLYDRQEAAFKNHGFPLSHLSSPKLRLVDADLTQRGFGLSSDLIKELSLTVTHIIHNAWKVDFVKPISDFEDLIQGTRRIIDFATSCTTRPSLSFISTVSVFPRSHDLNQDPEKPLEDCELLFAGGYVQSKWVGERLCQIASEKSLLNTNVIRVGLLSGGMNGHWDTSHWIPSVVQSAIRGNCLPSSQEQISWIPINVAAAAIVEMRTAMNDTLHIVHPHPIPLLCIMKQFASMLKVPLVPYDEWFARLQRSANTNSNSLHRKRWEGCSALKLIDFFRLGTSSSRNQNTESMGLIPHVVLGKGRRASQTLASEELRPLGVDDVIQWMVFWRRVGFISWE